MYAPIPDIGSLLIAALVFVLLTPIVFKLASRLARHLGVQGVGRPSYFKLAPIALAIWAAVLMLPSLIGSIVGVMMVWFTVYFLIVSSDIRKQNFGRASLVTFYVAVGSLTGIGILLAILYFSLLSFKL